MTGNVAPLASSPARGPQHRSGPEKRRPSLFWVCAAIAVPPIKLFTRLTLQEGDRLPAKGPFILAPNHYTEIDPIVVGVAVWRLGRAPRFLAKEALFRVPVIGWLLTRTGQIPVQRGGASRGAVALTSAKRLIDRGESVVIYPEGSLTRDPDLWPMRGKTGAVRVALEHDIPIIPVAHWGAQDLMSRYGRKFRLWPRAKIRMRFGAPVDLSEFRGRPLDQVVLNAATARVIDAITVLLEELREQKAPVARWDPQEHRQQETGRFD